MSVIQSQNYRILIDEDIAILRSFIDQMKASNIFVLVDQNTKTHCLGYLEQNLNLHFSSIQITSGEKYKNLNTCSQVWNTLIEYGCDRHSLIINLGGGVIGDMGGFIASCFMRGIPFIHMPTSLLSQVDASIGGKLAVDFMAYKNMIGLFNDPVLVWIQSQFLKSLPERELKSGYAEIIKHGLIYSKDYWLKIKSTDLDTDTPEFGNLIHESIGIKNEIVQEDPNEKGIRKILNFGHTIGHAIESFYLNSDTTVLHGEAIAAGMICESHISYQKSLLKKSELKEITNFIHTVFSNTFELKKHEDSLINLMLKDKKNLKQKILISTITEIGNCKYDIECSRDEILKSFEYFENTY
jgi:3-dehydroquinate synthase